MAEPERAHAFFEALAERVDERLSDCAIRCVW
jgi:hypothetical protein